MSTTRSDCSNCFSVRGPMIGAVIAGWTTTEVGRQPWIIYGVMRTAEAVTPVPRLIVPFITFTLLYIFLAAITVWLLLRQVAASPEVFESEGKDAQLAA